MAEIQFADIHPPISLEALARIPETMKQEKRWICWGGDKVPISVRGNQSGQHYGIDVKNPQNWGSYNEAVASIGAESYVARNEEYYHIVGIGFIVGDGWACFDFDGGTNHGGKEDVPESVVHDVLNTLGTYAEISLSGCGYHAFCKTTFVIGRDEPESNHPHRDPEGNPVTNSYEVEFFTRRKFIAITGNIVPGSGACVTDYTDGARFLYEKYIFSDWLKDEAKRKAEREKISKSVTVDMDEARRFFLLNYPEILSYSDSSNFKRGGKGHPLGPGEYSWIGAVKSMQDAGIPEDAIMEWCRRGSNFKSEKDVRRVLNEPLKSGKSCLGSIVQDAKNNGWKADPEKLTGDPKANHEARLQREAEEKRMEEEYRTERREELASALAALGIEYRDDLLITYNWDDSVEKVIDEKSGEILYPSTAAGVGPDQLVPGKTVNAAKETGKAKTIPRLETFGADFFNNNDIEPPPPIISRILYPGLGGLGAPPKMGKSYQVLQLAVCVTTGKKFMGFDIVRPGPVLYLDLQGTKARTKKRLKSMGYDRMPEGLEIAYHARRTDGGIIEQLEEQIQEKHFVLIIIDMLQQIKGAQRKTEDAYQADNRILEPIHDLALRHNISILVVFHTRKGNKLILSDDPFEEILGSTGQFGSMDCAWMITGKRVEEKKRFSVICRDNDEGQMDFEAEFKNHTWNVIGTVEECEEKRAKDAYERDPVVYTIRELAADDSGWSGSMSDLMREVAEKTEQYPAPSPEKMRNIVDGMRYRLSCEGIVIQYPSQKGGGKGRKYLIYRKRPEQESYWIPGKR